MPRAWNDSRTPIATPTPSKAGSLAVGVSPLTPPQSPPPGTRVPLTPACTSDQHVPDNYVQHTLQTVPALPPITLENFVHEVEWLNVFVFISLPALSLWGAFTVHLKWQTAALAVFWYFLTGLGITAGYHRLWAHRAYNASKPLEYFLAIASAGAVEGSIKWWCRGHRAHHRYTDTELDPYNADRGIIYSHIGWMVLKPRRKPGVADVSDLANNPIVRWQHRWFVELLLTVSFVIPTLIAGLGWGDYSGGFFFVGAARLLFVHHSTFCVNSLAHWLGEQPFDDKNTPKDHFLTALVTVGEGYHNFHHQFPMDYRNAIKWYQYDPTKWFIAVCEMLGLASQLKTFPENEIAKGQLSMELKRLRTRQDGIKFPEEKDDMPVIDWDSFQAQSLTRPLILVSGFIHDLSSFIDSHPGGRALLTKNVGRDATTAFHGGVYAHSNAAHNLLAMMRVGVLHGGLEQESLKAVPPGQRMRIMRIEEVRAGKEAARAEGAASVSAACTTATADVVR